MWQDILGLVTKIYSINLIRYFVFAGVAYYVFYIWKRNEFAHKKIQKREIEKSKMVDEVKYSIASLFIFSLMAIVVYFGTRSGILHVYKNFNDHSVSYFIFSILAAIVLHDTYFYWSHRFMHIKWVFARVHRIHHLSNNPSPWAAFSFHPTEAVIEAAILPLMLLILPMHPLAIVVFLLYMTGMNVMGHLGYEIYPKGFLKNPIGKLQNTSTHHNMHHRLVNCNYGLYFNVWDLLMKTNHTRYQEEFEKVASAEQLIKSEI